MCRVIREIKSHVYGKRQMADSSGELPRITVQNNSYGQNWRETTHFLVEVINNKEQLRGKQLRWFAVWGKRELFYGLSEGSINLPK